MKFVAKHLIRFILFSLVSVLAVELLAANCCFFQNHSYDNPQEAILGHLSASHEALNQSIWAIKEGEWK